MLFVTFRSSFICKAAYWLLLVIHQTTRESQALISACRRSKSGPNGRDKEYHRQGKKYISKYFNTQIYNSICKHEVLLQKTTLYLLLQIFISANNWFPHLMWVLPLLLLLCWGYSTSPPPQKWCAACWSCHLTQTRHRWAEQSGNNANKESIAVGVDVAAHQQKRCWWKNIATGSHNIAAHEN